jgi:basic amino acid/polyamine antiporter, APA family
MTPTMADRDPTSRPVGPWALLALGINGIVGVGIFFLPADVARQAPGWASVLVFAATAIALLPVALTFAALGTRFTEDGGPVVFARAAFGERASFAVGWVAYVSAISSASAVMVGLVSAVGPGMGITGARPQGLAAFCLATLLAGICALGLKLSARTWTGLTVLKLLPLLALAVVFALAAASSSGTAPAAPAAPAARDWLAAALTAVFAYQGFEIVPVIAGQARSPERSVPWATMGSLLFSAVLYVVLQAACVYTLPNLSASGAPLAEAAGVLGGPVLSGMLAAGTSVSALGIAFGMTVTTPHYLATLARGGGLGWDLDRLDARHVPLRSLTVTWVLVSVLVQAGSRSELFALSSVAVLAQFVVTAVALAALAWRKERGLTRAHLALALPAAVVGTALASGASRREALVAGAALLLGVVLRFLSPRVAGPTQPRT